MRILILFTIIGFNTIIYGQKVINGSFKNTEGWNIDFFNDYEKKDPSFSISHGVATRNVCTLPDKKNQGISQTISGHNTTIGENRYVLKFTLFNFQGDKSKVKVLIDGGTFEKGTEGIGLLNGNEVTHGEGITFNGKMIHRITKEGTYEIDYYATSSDITFRFAANNPTTVYSLDNISIEGESITDTNSTTSGNKATSKRKKQSKKNLQNALIDLYN